MTIQITATGPDELVAVTGETPVPGAHEVLVSVRAAGVNPADYATLAAVGPTDFPRPVGFEAAGVVAAVGAEVRAELQPGTRVIAFLIQDGYASDVVVPEQDVFLLPDTLDFAQGANLMLVSTAAAQMLHTTRVQRGDTIVVHGASGASGVSVLQQAKLLGARVIGTASPRNFDVVRRFGGEPVEYGPGLVDRLRALAPEGFAAALDCVGTEEALQASIEVVADRDRIITIAGYAQAPEYGIHGVSGAEPETWEYRLPQRQRMIDLAAQGLLTVPVAHTFPLEQAAEAWALQRTGHPGGKLALVP